VASSDLNWSPVSWVLGVVLLCFSLCICFFIWLQLKKKVQFSSDCCYVDIFL
jgi:hypothetical protein